MQLWMRNDEDRVGVTMSALRSHRPIPIAQWPELDREAWLTTLRSSGRFTAQAARKLRWRDITRQGLERGYGCWLAWLEATGQLDQTLQPADRATEDRLESYVSTMQSQGLADYTVAGRAGDVGRALSAMSSNADVSWIQRGAALLFEEAEPRKDLRQYLRPATELVDLGFDLMASEADAGLKGGSYRSVRFRDGLLIAFLIHCPLRRRNLASLELGHHLTHHAGVWRLEIPADETKTQKAVRHVWPDVLVASLELYLDVHRPGLLSCGSGSGATNKLWISRLGAPLSANEVYQRVVSRTEAAFGRPVNPHLFRHIAASDIATLTPQSYTAIMDILGHGSLRSSEKFYNRANMIAAANRVNESIDSERRYCPELA